MTFAQAGGHGIHPASDLKTLNATAPLRMRCPKCSAAVRASATLAGKRVKCPTCGGAIKLPGSVHVVQDDDWLSLDDPLPSSGSAPANSEAQVASRAGRVPASRPPAPAPTPSGDETSDWLDDLPPVSEATRSSSADQSGLADADLPPLSDSDWAALDDVGGFDPHGSAAAERTKSKKNASAAPTEVTEYRAKCPICDALHYVRPPQAGKSFRCGDCHSDFVVPPPPKPVVKQTFDLERAATFQLSEVVGERDPHGAPGSKSAAEYLREAEDAETEEEIRSRYDDPDVSAWLRGIFGIFTDPSVACYWLALSLLGTIPGVVAVVIGHPLLLVGSSVLTLLYGAFVLVCGFAILEAVAGGQQRVDEWPAFDPVEWFGPSVTTLLALAISAMPGAVIAVPLFGATLATVGLIMFSVYLMFPFVLLSMLDNDSVFMPVSSDVTRSVSRCKESWGTLYFSAALLFFFYYVAIVVLSFTPPVVNIFFGCVLSVGLIFIYFSMIGQLAFSIGQSVNAGPAGEE